MAAKYTKWPQHIPNGHKIYQMAAKYTKWPQNIPNGHKIYQMAAKYTKWPQNIPKRVKINQWKTKYTKSNGHPRRTDLDEIAFCEWVPVQPASLCR
jgi:late competence protein required for DNA uptake (superfamily II DNA/RNA helicase)